MGDPGPLSPLKLRGRRKWNRPRRLFFCSGGSGGSERPGRKLLSVRGQLGSGQGLVPTSHFLSITPFYCPSGQDTQWILASLYHLPVPDTGFFPAHPATFHP